MRGSNDKERSMISIEKYSEKWKFEISQLSVKPEQAIFTVGKISDVILSLKEHEHPHVIVEDGKVAGFFLFDLSYSDTYQFGSLKSLGIRSLLIDQRFQGRGVATEALNQLPRYVVANYPEFEALQLTVNCRNKAAYGCYQKCGFEDTNELYVGGPAGPQHIMQKRLL